MKHIFTVHSPLTFLVAYAVIKHLKLSNEDVIIISSNYELPLKDYAVYPSFADQHKSFWKKLRTLNLPKHYDKYVTSITQGAPFTAYIDLMSYYQRILITHKDCRQFHFIEEGNSAYQEFDDLTDITWHERDTGFRHLGLDRKSIARVLRGYNLRLLGLPYIYSAYAFMENIQFYAFSNNAFYNVPNAKRVLVKPEKQDKHMLSLAGNYVLENEVIWLDGSNGSYTGLDESYYHQAIKKAITALKNRNILVDKVYVKLRPGIKNPENIPLVRILSEEGLEVKIMPDDMIFESFLLCSKNCHVIGTLTAALEYAYVFGHKAYSIYGLFEKQPPTFFDRMTGFWKNVEKLGSES